MVVEDHHHHIAGFELVFHLQQACHGRTGAVAGKNPFLAGNAARHDGGIAVGHLFEMVNHVEIDIGREEILADAFGDIRVDFVLVEDAGFLVFLENRTVGIDAEHLDGRILFLEILSGAADGSAGAHAYDQMGDFPFGLFPDFRASLLVMCLRIAEVVVLVGLPGIRDFIGQTC